MAAAAIAAIRKKSRLFGRGSGSDQKQEDLLGRLPSRESRELDIELGILIAG
jgi:hypothetical protein